MSHIHKKDLQFIHTKTPAAPPPQSKSPQSKWSHMKPTVEIGSLRKLFKMGNSHLQQSVNFIQDLWQLNDSEIYTFTQDQLADLKKNKQLYELEDICNYLKFSPEDKIKFNEVKVSALTTITPKTNNQATSPICVSLRKLRQLFEKGTPAIKNNMLWINMYDLKPDTVTVQLDAHTIYMLKNQLNRIETLAVDMCLDIPTKTYIRPTEPLNYNIHIKDIHTIITPEYNISRELKNRLLNILQIIDFSPVSIFIFKFGETKLKELKAGLTQNDQDKLNEIISQDETLTS